MKNVMLEYYQSPGDTVVSSAAVTSMMIDYNKEIKLFVKGVAAYEVFKHNPFISQNIPDNKIDLNIKMKNDLINSSHLPNHFLQSYCITLSKAIQKEVKLKFSHPIINLNSEEKNNNDNIKYWIISLPGRKNDYTVKRWPVEYMQEVIDYYKSHINFIQTGESCHNHPPLKNVINKIGKTNLRELIKLIFHSQGVITGESLCHHIAAAFKKPCITIASGWLSKNWVDYSTCKFLSKHGCLSCCKNISCGKSRTVKLDDNDDEKNKKLCVYPMHNFSEPIPKCMTMITPKEVINAINDYYFGGILNF